MNKLWLTGLLAFSSLAVGGEAAGEQHPGVASLAFSDPHARQGGPMGGGRACGNLAASVGVSDLATRNLVEPGSLREEIGDGTLVE